MQAQIHRATGNAVIGLSRLLRRLLALLIPGDPQYPEIADRSAYERFAIPFIFKPRLSILEATVSAVAMFFRIVAGCVLFAIWGTYTLLVWFDVENLLWRFAILLALLAVFVLSLALMIFVTTALARVFIPTKGPQV